MDLPTKEIVNALKAVGKHVTGWQTDDGQRVANFGANFKRPTSRTLTHSRVASERDGALSVRCSTHR